MTPSRKRAAELATRRSRCAALGELHAGGATLQRGRSVQPRTVPQAAISHDHLSHRYDTAVDARNKRAPPSWRGRSRAACFSFRGAAERLGSAAR
jgi:hypothetical protein